MPFFENESIEDEMRHCKQLIYRQKGSTNKKLKLF
jgi:hypothetical protein